jgi:hypothetical protein
MLPFGSITSVVPLFVLAFAYLIYFGASALTKTKSENPALSKELAVKTQLPYNQLTIPDYRDIVVSSDAVPAEVQVISCLSLPDSFPPGIPVRRIIPLFCGSDFSPRPPPFQGLSLQVC